MAQNHWRPTPGRFGTHPVMVENGPLGSMTANTTTSYYLPTPSGNNRRSYVDTVHIQVLTVPVDADGTLVATLKKFDVSAAADVVLSSGLNLEALTAKTATAFVIPSTVTESQRRLDPGDVLFVDVVNDSAAIDTQWVQAFISAELLLQN